MGRATAQKESVATPTLQPPSNMSIAGSSIFVFDLMSLCYLVQNFALCFGLRLGPAQFLRVRHAKKRKKALPQP